jgi:hypothetical protein
LPKDFPTRATPIVVDYDYVSINAHDYLMPISAEVSLLEGRHEAMLNTIEFRDYRRFGSNVKILNFRTMENSIDMLRAAPIERASCAPDAGSLWVGGPALLRGCQCFILDSYAVRLHSVRCARSSCFQQRGNPRIKFPSANVDELLRGGISAQQHGDYRTAIEDYRKALPLTRTGGGASQPGRSACGWETSTPPLKKIFAQWPWRLTRSLCAEPGAGLLQKRGHGACPNGIRSGPCGQAARRKGRSAAGLHLHQTGGSRPQAVASGPAGARVTKRTWISNMYWAMP